MDFLEAQNYLEKVRSQKGIVLGLDTMRHLMAKLNNPQDKVKFIQVAGTNGKGSTAAYLTSILSEAGIKVGRYTSPAVFSSTEQYFACGSCISESEYAKGVTAVAEAAASLDGETPTAFEQETALAFWYFAKKGCELAILEAGLGGDMDATNIVTTTVCSIITSISMDHCRILGNKISEIAAHKAGIIKPGAPVICIEQKEDAMEPIRAAAKAADTPLYEVHRDEVRQIFSDKRESIVFFREFENLHLKMLGSCQPENAVLAVQAASVLSRSYPIEKKHIYDGIEKTRWGGRVARMCSEIYGGLGQDAGQYLHTTFEAKNNELILEKDIDLYSVCEHHLLPFYGKAHIAYIPDGRVAGLSKLARTIEVFAKRPQIQEQLTAQTADALMEHLKPKGVMVVIEAEHMCMTMRGVRKPGTKTLTYVCRGVFENNDELINRVLMMVR